MNENTGIEFLGWAESRAPTMEGVERADAGEYTYRGVKIVLNDPSAGERPYLIRVPTRHADA